MSEDDKKLGNTTAQGEHVVKPSLKNAKAHKSITKPKSFRWDEKTIAEQDLDRGTRQKVDEPKTPYAGPVTDPAVPELEGEAGSFCLDNNNQGETERYKAALLSALTEAKDQEDQGKPGFWDRPPDEDEETHKQNFEEKRRKHYQMFK